MAEKYEISVEDVPDRLDLVKLRKAIEAATGEVVGFDLSRDAQEKLAALRVHVTNKAQYLRILAVIKRLQASEIEEEVYDPPSIKELDERLKAVEAAIQKRG